MKTQLTIKLFQLIKINVERTRASGVYQSDVSSAPVHWRNRLTHSLCPSLRRTLCPEGESWASLANRQTCRSG